MNSLSQDSRYKQKNLGLIEVAATKSRAVTSRPVLCPQFTANLRSDLNSTKIEAKVVDQQKVFKGRK